MNIDTVVSEASKACSMLRIYQELARSQVSHDSECNSNLITMACP